MATIFKPPIAPVFASEKSVFLAGTIDNGNSVDWQASVEASLSDMDVVILNPRRDTWDSSWQQSIENPLFKAQVVWELDGLEQVDWIFMYISPTSKSPITLLELGLMARSSKLILVSPLGFWRRGNIEVVADRFAIPLFEELEEGLDYLKAILGH